ncbi:MAG TPA: hypothetical protein VKA73_12960 [Rubrobacter sp.]|nr:hypothetical protein [Rubrobacter sp.]
MGSFGRIGGPFRPRFAFMAVGLVLGLLFALVALTPFHFVPFFPLFWVLPFLAVRAMGFGFARSRPLPAGGRSDGDHRERELLEALERRGRITAARAALETSLSVAEADERLSELANRGHLRVTAQDGSLAYSLWDSDRREIEDGAP